MKRYIILFLVVLLFIFLSKNLVYGRIHDGNGFGGDREEWPFSWNRFPPLIECGDEFLLCLQTIFFEWILKTLLFIAPILAILSLVLAGLQYIAYGNDNEKRKKIKNRIIYSLIGLTVAILAYAFVQILESFLRAPSVYLPLVLAQIEEPSIPSYLNCGSQKLPSVLTPSSSRVDIWKICLIYWLGRILNFLYILALILGIIFLILAGLQYILQPDQAQKIHQKILGGVIGIVIAILSFTIVKIIDLFFTGR